MLARFLARLIAFGQHPPDTVLSWHWATQQRQLAVAVCESYAVPSDVVLALFHLVGGQASTFINLPSLPRLPVYGNAYR